MAIKQLGTAPSGTTDAATKAYVDAAAYGGQPVVTLTGTSALTVNALNIINMVASLSTQTFTLPPAPAQGSRVTVYRQDGNGYTSFGAVVAGSGDTFLTGPTPFVVSGPGVAFTWQYQGTTWVQINSSVPGLSALWNASTNALFPPSVMLRDSSGRSQVVAPSAANDISTKAYVDTSIDTSQGQPTYTPANLLNNFNSMYSVYNWKGSNTQHLVAGVATALAGGASGQLFIGDSLTDGCINVTGPVFDRLNAWPMIFRDGLGVPVAGSGFIRCQDASWQDPRIVSPGWTANTTNIFAQTSGVTSTFTADRKSTCVSVIYAGGAGTGGFTVSVDGATSGAGFTTVTAGSGVITGTRVNFTGLRDIVHTVAVTTTSATLTILIGFEAYETTGFVANNVSQSGATAYGTGQNSWSDLTASAGMLLPSYAQPALYSTTISAIHIALGANDLQVPTSPASISTALTSIVSTLRSAFPAADIVLHMLSQANVLPVPANQTAWNAFWSMMYTLADTLDCVLVDWQQILGGWAMETTNGLVGDTLIHFSRAGYSVLGRTLAQLLGVGTADAANKLYVDTAVNRYATMMKIGVD